MSNPLENKKLKELLSLKAGGSLQKRGLMQQLLAGAVQVKNISA